MTGFFGERTMRNLRSLFLVFLAGLYGVNLSAQSKADGSAHDYPKSIRGYKLEKARIRVSKLKSESRGDPGEDVPDAIVQIGTAKLESITPLGITFQLPVTLSAVKQGGHVDFLTFEDVVVNGTQVQVEDYHSEFELPVTGTAELPSPIKVSISLPHAFFGVLDEWSDSKSTWNISARVYVFGRFRKFLMKFKRVIPVEIQQEISNPLHETKTDTDVPSNFADHQQIRLSVRAKLENVRSGVAKTPLAIEGLCAFVVFPNA
jgi:hypothetical protein